MASSRSPSGNIAVRRDIEYEDATLHVTTGGDYLTNGIKTSCDTLEHSTIMVFRPLRFTMACSPVAAAVRVYTVEKCTTGSQGDKGSRTCFGSTRHASRMGKAESVLM